MDYIKQNEFEAKQVITSEVTITLDQKLEELREVNQSIQENQDRESQLLARKQEIESVIAALEAIGISPRNEQAEL